jgi:hypothetical protein
VFDRAVASIVELASELVPPGFLRRQLPSGDHDRLVGFHMVIHHVMGRGEDTTAPSSRSAKQGNDHDGSSFPHPTGLASSSSPAVRGPIRLWGA